MGREVKVHRQGGTCLRSSTLEAEAREHDLNLQTEGYPEKDRKKVLEHRLMRYPRHVFTPTTAGFCVKKLSKSNVKGINMTGCKTTCPVTEEKRASVFED